MKSSMLTLVTEVCVAVHVFCVFEMYICVL